MYLYDNVYGILFYYRSHSKQQPFGPDRHNITNKIYLFHVNLGPIDISY